MTTPIQNSIQDLMSRMKSIIENANVAGNLDGLLANFILKDNTNLKITWNVNSTQDKWIQEHKQLLEKGNYFHIAALGYSLAIYNIHDNELMELFNSGLEILEKRDAFPADRISFAFMPKVFLGLVLGVKCLSQDIKMKKLEWLTGIYKKVKELDTSDRLQNLLYLIIEVVMSGKQQTLSYNQVIKYEKLEERAVIFWASQQNLLKIYGEEKDLFNFKKALFTDFIVQNIESTDAATAPFILSTINSLVMGTIDTVVLTRSHVARILNNFESAMKRWKWSVNDEKAVQNIVWLILRSYFDDVVDEEHLPKFGHSSSIVDFGIPSLSILVEVKFTRQKGDFKKIEDEIKIDSINYLHSTDDYDRLLVFVYDDSSSVQEHATTINALKQIPDIEDVIIVSRPSHLS